MVSGKGLGCLADRCGGTDRSFTAGRCGVDACHCSDDDACSSLLPLEPSRLPEPLLELEACEEDLDAD